MRNLKWHSNCWCCDAAELSTIISDSSQILRHRSDAAQCFETMNRRRHTLQSAKSTAAQQPLWQHALSINFFAITTSGLQSIVPTGVLTERSPHVLRWRRHNQRGERRMH